MSSRDHMARIAEMRCIHCELSGQEQQGRSDAAARESEAGCWHACVDCLGRDAVSDPPQAAGTQNPMGMPAHMPAAPISQSAGSE